MSFGFYVYWNGYSIDWICVAAWFLWVFFFSLPFLLNACCFFAFLSFRFVGLFIWVFVFLETLQRHIWVICKFIWAFVTWFTPNDVLARCAFSSFQRKSIVESLIKSIMCECWNFGRNEKRNHLKRRIWSIWNVFKSAWIDKFIAIQRFHLIVFIYIGIFMQCWACSCFFLSINDFCLYDE